MIRVKDLKNTDTDPNTFLISAFADTKEEVDTGTFIGLPANATIEMGSTVITADGDVAFMKSNGTWNWVE